MKKSGNQGAWNLDEENQERERAQTRQGFGSTIPRIQGGRYNPERTPIGNRNSYMKTGLTPPTMRRSRNSPTRGGYQPNMSGNSPGRSGY